MSTLVIILFFMATLLCAVQFSLFPDKRIKWGWMAAMALWVYFMHGKAVEQSYARFAGLLSNTGLMTDFTVVQTVESIAGILLALYLVKTGYNGHINKRLQYLVYFPGVVFLPALFFFESFVFLEITGFRFELTALVLAVLFPLIVAGITGLIGWLVPEKPLRFELKFLLHLVQLAFAVTLSVLLFQLPVASSGIAPEGKPLLVLLVTALLFGLAGILLYNFKMKRLKQKVNGRIN